MTSLIFTMLLMVAFAGLWWSVSFLADRLACMLVTWFEKE